MNIIFEVIRFAERFVAKVEPVNATWLDLLRDYQTLIAGMLALGAALLTLWQTRRSSNAQLQAMRDQIDQSQKSSNDQIKILEIQIDTQLIPLKRKISYINDSIKEFIIANEEVRKRVELPTFNKYNVKKFMEMGYNSIVGFTVPDDVYLLSSHQTVLSVYKKDIISYYETYCSQFNAGSDVEVVRIVAEGFVEAGDLYSKHFTEFFSQYINIDIKTEQ